MSLQCKLKPGQSPVYRSEDGDILAVGCKPQWIKLPKQLGGRRVNILDSFVARSCKCGKHPANVMILDCDYMIVECTNGYMWMNKPNDIEQFKKTMM